MSPTDALASDEVPDPYYGGPEGFEKVLDLCEEGARGLVAQIVNNGQEGEVGLR